MKSNGKFYLVIILTVCVAVIMTSCQSGTSNQQKIEKKVINIGGTVSNAPYSPGIVAGNTMYCSGRLGTDPATGQLAEGIENQTKFSLESLKSVLKEGGFEMSDVVSVSVFLKNTDDYQAMNAVYAAFFPKDPPARATVTIADLVLEALIEISCIAVKTN